MPLTLRDYGPFITPQPQGSAMNRLTQTLRGIRQDDETERSALAREGIQLAQLAEEVRQADLTDEQRRRQHELDIEKQEHKRKIEQAGVMGVLAGQFAGQSAAEDFAMAAARKAGAKFGDRPGQAPAPPEMQAPGMPPTAPAAQYPGQPSGMPEQPSPGTAVPMPSLQAVPGAAPVSMPELAAPPGASPVDMPSLGVTEEGRRDLPKVSDVIAGRGEQATLIDSPIDIDDFADEEVDGEQLPEAPARSLVDSGLTSEIRGNDIYMLDAKTGELLSQRPINFKEPWVKEWAVDYSRALNSVDNDALAALSADVGTNKRALAAQKGIHFAYAQAGARLRTKALTPGQQVEDKDDTFKSGFDYADERWNDRERGLAHRLQMRMEADELVGLIKKGRGGGPAMEHAIKKLIKLTDSRPSNFDRQSIGGDYSLFDQLYNKISLLTKGRMEDRQYNDFLGLFEDKAVRIEDLFDRSVKSYMDQEDVFTNNEMWEKRQGYRSQAAARLEGVFELYPILEAKYGPDSRYRRERTRRTGRERPAPGPLGPQDRQANDAAVDDLVRLYQEAQKQALELDVPIGVP
ncbi:MAG: hypothetical protein V3U34_00455 [candidate division NC10 bacterium]